MNLVSSLVGLSIMGTAMPMVAQMAITPTVAAKRAENFATAEATAVAFSAAHDGKASLGAAPDGCTLTDLSEGAWSITCEEGENAYQARVTRSFRLANNAQPDEPRQFPYESRALGAHQCHVHDPWGMNWRRDWPTLQQCIPAVLWSKEAYLNSNPDDWLWDVNRMKGYGTHPDY